MPSMFKKYGRAKAYLAATDVLAFFAAFGLALRLRFRPHINVIELSTGEMAPELATVLLLGLLTVPAVFSAFRLYQRRTWLSAPAHASQIVKAVAVLLSGYMLLQFITKSTTYMEESRAVAGVWGVLTLLALFVNRVMIFPRLLAWAAQNKLHRRIALIGVNDFSRKFARQIAEFPDRYMMRSIGFIDNIQPAGTEVGGGLRVLGPMTKLDELADLHELEGAVIVAGEMEYGELMDYVEACVKTFGWVDVHASRTACLQQNLDPDTYFDIPFVRMGAFRQSATIQIQKRLLDLAGAGIGILLLSPLLLLSALLVRLTSRGPVLYIGERIGQGGRPFRFYKFRTMVVGADQDPSRKTQIETIYRSADEPMPSKCVNRSLLTPVGGLLRKWAIDELPQLFSVLKGDMSLVGPRPLPQGEYNLQDEWQKKRFEVKPGCTGLWKIYASWNREIPFSQSVLYDIYYARNATPLLDITIIVKTIVVILAGRADG